MDTTGGVMSGYSRSGSTENERMPNATSVKAITVAKTGRFTETSESHI